MLRAFLVGLGLSLLPVVASAAERQHHLGVAPVGALLKIKGFGLSPGIGATALYTYGLTDQFNLMAEVSHSFMGIGQQLVRSPSSMLSEATNNRPGHLSTGAAGISYVLDVLRWVPYGGVLVSGNLFGGGSMPSVEIAPGAQLALGLDYQFSRHVVGGIGLRQHVFFTKLADYPTFTTGFFKLEYQWGY